MTRKDYTAIAAELRYAHRMSATRSEQVGIEILSMRLADTFETNPRFDRLKFLEASRSDYNPLNA